MNSTEALDQLADAIRSETRKNILQEAIDHLEKWRSDLSHDSDAYHVGINDAILTLEELLGS